MDKLSVIIPVYNTEKYLPRCIESLINQTYKNIEYIFVNDCSPGNAEEIIKQYAEKDNRIKYVTYDKNRGLFRARVTGAKSATGDYIAFMDSDDYATYDYYNSLINCAKEKGAEIVVGKTIFKRIDNSECVRNLHDECFVFDIIKDEEVRKAYFEQKGLCFSWHTVWNKIYKKSLWDKCEPYFEKIKTHLIMTEDIAFSSLLFYNAKSVAKVDNDGYFYCENENASTNAAKTTIKRFTKNMADIKTVFDFVNEYFNEVGAEKYICDSFMETKKYYARMWRELADNTFKGDELYEAGKIMEDFLPDYKKHTTVDDHFFESVITDWNSGLESIKEEIAKSECKYVSFDIFDTLIMRYVYKPEDIFLLMNKKFEEIYRANISFDKIRIGAERECRRRFGESNPEYQDVNIDEIYDCLADYYDIPVEVAKSMEEEEKSLEISFSHRRNAAMELFNVAKATGKEVIFISDMYLDKDTINKMLEKAGYTGFKKLYLSSELRLTKARGDIFKAVVKDLSVSPKDIIHIGDTWVNDIVRPKSLGIKTIFFPKASEVFENKIQGLNSNLCHNIANTVCGTMCNSDEFKSSLGYRCMIALASGYYFDNPYRSFNKDSDFNCDPYFIGYYALGMHMVGLSRWICENTKDYDNIYFMARDGYLPMLAYNILKNENDCQGKYIYTSRKLLLPVMIENKEDFYDLPVEFRNHTPNTILDLLTFCSGKYEKEDLPFNLDETFKDEESYFSFIKYFIKNIYNKEVHNKATQKCKKYYAPLAEGNNISFDMGYSGRIQTAVSKACNKPVDALFIHRDSKRSNDMARKGKYNIKCFYDFYPYMSGLIREHILSDSSGSCIGIDDKGELIFDNSEKIYQDLFVVSNIQRGALDFAKDFKNIFGEYEDYISIKPYEVSMVFEGYLRCGKDIDRQIFKASYFEDLVYGSKDNINIYEFIKNYLLTLPVNEGAKNAITKRDMLEEVVKGHNRLVRAFAYIIFDPQLFKLYIIDILNRKPKVLRTLVKIKHIVFGRPGGKNNE
ncbi:MAG: HAD-IA family hydrolase [Lachnospirales bacterium]